MLNAGVVWCGVLLYYYKAFRIAHSFLLRGAWLVRTILLEPELIKTTSFFVDVTSNKIKRTHGIYRWW